MVDHVNQFEMSWKKLVKNFYVPPLQSFWQHSVIGVGERLVDDLPSDIRFDIFFINHDS